MNTRLELDGTQLRVKLPLVGGRTEAGLGAALDALLAVTGTYPAPLIAGDEPASVSTVTFHTPEKRWVSERRFFERCARHPSLAARPIRYVD